MDVSFFTHAVALSAIAVVVAHQLLKWQYFPLDFANKHPVPTNIGLSILASLYAVWQGNAPHPVTWSDWLLLAGTVSVAAALTYNQLLKNWQGLRATEAGNQPLAGASSRAALQSNHEHNS